MCLASLLVHGDEMALSGRALSIARGSLTNVAQCTPWAPVSTERARRWPHLGLSGVLATRPPGEIE